MNEITRQKLKRLEVQHNVAARKATSRGTLRVYYGWSKINKIQKREAIAIVFENEELAGDEIRRSGKSLRKQMEIVTSRVQTAGEASDAEYHNRVFTVYYIFLDDKKIGGSLERALHENMMADRKHVGKEELLRIANELRQTYKYKHPEYIERSNVQLCLDFDFSQDT